MTILRLLSEEVFDYSEDSMVARKVSSMKAALTGQFVEIFQLCDLVLGNSQAPALVAATLKTLQRYLTWIPAGFIFETKLVESLVLRFFPRAELRNVTLGCLTEIGGLTEEKYNTVFGHMFVAVVERLGSIVPAGVTAKQLYDNAQAEADEETQVFVRNMALFLIATLKAHQSTFETQGDAGSAIRSALGRALDFLLSATDTDDVELFKICVEFWRWLAEDLHLAQVKYDTAASVLGMLGGQAGAAAGGTNRAAMYDQILSRLRVLMISRMVKPEEVLVETAANGDIIRSRVASADTIALHEQCRDVLVFLTHLNPGDMTEIMKNMIGAKLDMVRAAKGEGFTSNSWDDLNRLCWATGAIAGTLNEDVERDFLVRVIKTLLSLTELVRASTMEAAIENKAVIAADIMYVVGQYPRFLKAHWRFLVTVIVKLFEFMHETFPGVQDMAVDTFLKIARRCRKQFVVVQRGETEPFVNKLVSHYVRKETEDLQAHQVQTFFEAAGVMVAAHPASAQQEALTTALMTLPGNAWKNIMASVSANLDGLKEVPLLTEMQRVLQIHARVAKVTGPAFAKYLCKVYLDFCNVYRTLSVFVSQAVAESGAVALNSTTMRQMRAVREAILLVIGTFVLKVNDSKLVLDTFVQPLVESVFAPYAESVPELRESGAVQLAADLITALRKPSVPVAPQIITPLFEPTLSMINTSFEEFPEHRTAFYALCDALVQHATPVIWAMPGNGNLMFRALIWAMKHTDRAIADAGVATLSELIDRVSPTHGASPECIAAVHANYYLLVLKELLVVLTDRMHQAQFVAHCELLRKLIALAKSGRLACNLWEHAGSSAPADGSNATWLHVWLRELLHMSFTNLQLEQIEQFVAGLMAASARTEERAYQQHIRDFLITMLEFTANPATSGLYEQERAQAAEQERQRRAAVAGLAALPDDDDDL